MDPILAYARAKQNDVVSFIRELVECESPSDDPESVAEFVTLFSKRIEDIAVCKSAPGGEYGPHLRCEFELPGGTKRGQILALGHSDTVHPLGSLKTMPFKRKRLRLFGPGILDMKAGIAFFVFAMRALRELGRPVTRRVVLQLNSDEEVGSESSRSLTENEAAKSLAVLVLEPGTGLEGKLKTARKGVGDYSVVVHGNASHAGVDFESGASAVVELARQIDRIARFTDLRRGITVNPGVVSGGTRTNVVAAEAWAEIDIRVARKTDAAVLASKFKALKPFDPRCRIEVEGGLNRPPMERSPAIASLFAQARDIALELGVKLEESSTGGGSDGNFTAALGIPTLDGLGAVGEGAHTPGECILVDRIADRIALLARLVEAL